MIIIIIIIRRRRRRRNGDRTDFKSPECDVVRGLFEITSLITPELHDTKSYYERVHSKNTRNFLCQQLKKDSQNLWKTFE